MFRVSLCGLALLLSGCAAQMQQDKMKAALDPYVGRTIADYVVARGPPQQQTSLGAGQRLYEWILLAPTPGVAMVLPGSNMIVSRPAGTTSCTVAMVANAQSESAPLNQWVITGYRWNGAC
jgi:hypothetical protein